MTLINFGADGLEFKVGYWIADPENGSDGLKSLINLEILRSLREHHIEIPFPATGGSHPQPLKVVLASRYNQ